MCAGSSLPLVLFQWGHEHTHPVASNGERLVNVVGTHLYLGEAGVCGVKEDFWMGDV
jgi:hypothetical protein